MQLTLQPEIYWHLTDAQDAIFLHNAFLGKGYCKSVSDISRQPGLKDVVSKYGLKFRVGDAKEMYWESVRAKHFPTFASREGTIYLFEDEKAAKLVSKIWFHSEERFLVRAQIVTGSRIHRADAKWLDQPQEDWETAAHQYWSGEVTASPLIEVLVDGAVYCPDWQSLPFGLLQPRR